MVYPLPFFGDKFSYGAVGAEGLEQFDFVGAALLKGGEHIFGCDFFGLVFQRVKQFFVNFTSLFNAVYRYADVLYFFHSQILQINDCLQFFTLVLNDFK